MRYLSYALVLMFGFALVASAADIGFKAAWEPPLNADGTPQEIDNYVVYACDQPMPDSFGGVLTDNPIIGTCPGGNLMTFEVPGDRTFLADRYVTEGKKKKGDVHIRVTARRAFKMETEDQYLESEPSNQVMFSYFDKPGRPKGVTVEQVTQ